jgi:hypothetical protein
MWYARPAYVRDSSPSYRLSPVYLMSDEVWFGHMPLEEKKRAYLLWRIYARAATTHACTHY